VSSRTLLARFLLCLGLVVATGGCSLFDDDGPSAREAADELAVALSTGRLDPVSFTGVRRPQQWWDDAVAGLDGTELDGTGPEVTVEEVAEDDDTATARLTYRWQLPRGPVWSYRTSAQLSRGEEGWSVAARPSLVAPGLRAGERLVLSRELPARAEILGAGGTPLVTERPVVRFGLDHTRVSAEQRLTSARSLARALDIDVASYVAQVEAAGPKAFVEALVLRSDDVTPAIRAAVERIEGAVGVDDTLPLAPTRDFARPILGTVGPVTAEVVKSSDGFYRPGDEAGLSGLQQRYDEQLRGTPGVTVEAVDAEGNERALFEEEPQPGRPLRVTLDERLQTAAERLLAEVAPASAVVALEPSTGDVLAAASGPGGGGISTATVGQYAPGSTMKVVTSLALLRQGVAPDSPMSCPATTTVDGKQFKNYSDYPASQQGRIDLARALAHSCNTAFIGERDRVSQADLAQAAASLGLGVDHDLGYPVFLGSVPSDAASETDHAASLIGQGRVLASPVALAAVAASVASGAAVVPHLVPDQEDVRADPEEPLTETEAEQLRALMRGVVATGSGASLADVPGPPVMAKTGTAEFGDRQPPQTHAWMIAVQGDLAVAVFVELGESGSQTAGPILEDFLRAAG
jgi:cell division protein FtsI/penicillin-binding protein 2